MSRSKRYQDFSPSGLTPKAKSRTQSLRAKPSTAKNLFACDDREEGGAPQLWSRREEEGLVQFLFKQEADSVFSKWPPFGDGKLWAAASEIVTKEASIFRSSMYTSN